MNVFKNVRQFLTPGWVLTAIVAIAFSYLAFTVLAPWQLGKNTATQHRNQQLEHSFELDPVDVNELMPKGKGFVEGNEWRRVTATGSFLPDTRVLLRNRPVNGAPAVQVLDVFVANNGENYLVNRGFVRPTDSSTPNVEPAPKGTLTISAFTRRNEIPAETAPIAGTPPQVYGINTKEVSELVDTELNPDWLQLSDKSDAVIEAIPLPTLESGPYLSYGIQWIFFGALVPLAVVWFIRAEIVERRRDRAEQEEMAKNLRDAAEPVDDADATEAATPESDDDATPTPPPAKSDEDRAAELHRQRMAQRYGNTGHRAAGYRDNRYDERF
ncbi:SURF1 family cytochrome oxidase biogenesis protein [Corynebacterium sp. MSK035]|uniref:SURF1 family cytochrome oxidase biogenesis protein n=1 Tax=unclassified Corynebacterium TaxID=2624378 RepID=UPI000A57DA1F|nr:MULTISPECIES: SURF1 family cytochrome oxidase biogenesis protein [unclassified Corynebacterium]MDK8810304.1 SURF1 family cytochrome oxidase biogenesis protein [Corynebacterium sp. MSK035]